MGKLIDCLKNLTREEADIVISKLRLHLSLDTLYADGGWNTDPELRNVWACKDGDLVLYLNKLWIKTSNHGRIGLISFDSIRLPFGKTNNWDKGAKALKKKLNKRDALTGLYTFGLVKGFPTNYSYKDFVAFTSNIMDLREYPDMCQINIEKDSAIRIPTLEECSVAAGGMKKCGNVVTCTPNGDQLVLWTSEGAISKIKPTEAGPIHAIIICNNDASIQVKKICAVPASGN